MVQIYVEPCMIKALTLYPNPIKLRLWHLEPEAAALSHCLTLPKHSAAV